MGKFECPQGHMILFCENKGYGIVIVDKDRFRIVTPAAPKSITEAHRHFADYMVGMLEDQHGDDPPRVTPANACQECGEDRMDELVWIGDDTVECQQCGDQRVYQ